MTAVLLISARDIWSYAGEVATLFGVFLSALAIAGATRALWRRTLGRRRQYVRRLARLGTNAQLSFFSAVIGEPPAMRRDLTLDRMVVKDSEQVQVVRELAPYVEHVFIDRDFYVQAITDAAETVVAFAVTTRTRRFTPTFSSGPEGNVPLLKVQLGKTRFADLPEIPDRIRASLGARRFSYSEQYYLGNPGAYQWFLLAFNDAGAGDAPAQKLFPPMRHGGEFTWDGAEGSPDNDPALAAYRRGATINTFGVAASALGDSPYPAWVGADYDQVRTLP